MHGSFVAVRDEFFPHPDIEDEKVVPAFAEFIPYTQWEEMDTKALKSIPPQVSPQGSRRRSTRSFRPYPSPVAQSVALRCR
jgi:hypothetical protein